MKQINAMVAALCLFAFSLLGSTASAADKHHWTGRDDDGCRYTFENTGGESWTGSITVRGKTTTGDYTEVTRTDDFVELQVAGDKDERVRLYKDKFSFRTKGSDRWVEMGKGKWGY